MFTSQLYRVLKSPTLWLGSLVYVAAMLYMGISSCFAEYNMGFAASGFAWLDVLVAGTSYMSSFLTAFLPPLLCVLSGAGLVRQDVDCGLYKYAVMRAGHMKYLWAKLGAAVTGAVIFCLVSYGATLAIAYIAFPGYAAMPDFVMIWNRAFRTFGNYLAFHDYALLPVYTAASSTVACMSCRAGDCGRIAFKEQISHLCLGAYMLYAAQCALGIYPRHTSLYILILS